MALGSFRRTAARCNNSLRPEVTSLEVARLRATAVLEGLKSDQVRPRILRMLIVLLPAEPVGLLAGLVEGHLRRMIWAALLVEAGEVIWGPRCVMIRWVLCDQWMVLMERGTFMAEWGQEGRRLPSSVLEELGAAVCLLILRK